MKKVLKLFLLVVCLSLAFLFVGCTNDDVDEILTEEDDPAYTEPLDQDEVKSVDGILNEYVLAAEASRASFDESVEDFLAGEITKAELMDIASNTMGELKPAMFDVPEIETTLADNYYYATYNEAVANYVSDYQAQASIFEFLQFNDDLNEYAMDNYQNLKDELIAEKEELEQARNEFLMEAAFSDREIMDIIAGIEYHYIVEPDNEYVLDAKMDRIFLNEYESKQVMDDVGEPLTEKEYQLGQGADTYSKYWIKEQTYDGLEFTWFSAVEEQGDYWLMKVVCSDPQYQTIRGISVGDELAELQEAYPEATQALDGRTDPDNSAWQLHKDGEFTYLIFEVTDGVVSEIELYTEIP